MFLIIIPIFLALCVLFAYLYAYVPFGVLSLSKRLSVRISFFIFYAIFTLLIAFARLDIVVISPYTIAIVILSILILKRKGYFTNFTKVRVAMAGACLLVFTWQLEVPQRIAFESLIEAKVILSDRDYVVLEDKNNFGRTDNIAEGKWESYDDLFGIIRFSKKDFYACDTIDCKGKKKKIGEIHSSSISESTLHCALKLGGGCGLINASKSDSYSLLEYLKQNQNKQINKQGENNVTK
ncbi:hypothetical protein PTQ35_04135 [Campylobacter sp. 46490-21]|uniref:hypothetical protein n=1 Tax=Campylobacter magnus TaxID=3026462 RepID=UPI0023630BE8|nr:hypothetical protein [Campylobacter magnus]MDD0848006.1 hypothetical protein [Campylobacter magnus]